MASLVFSRGNDARVGDMRQIRQLRVDRFTADAVARAIYESDPSLDGEGFYIPWDGWPHRDAARAMAEVMTQVLRRHGVLSQSGLTIVRPWLMTADMWGMAYLVATTPGVAAMDEAHQEMAWRAQYTAVRTGYHDRMQNALDRLVKLGALGF